MPISIKCGYNAPTELNSKSCELRTQVGILRARADWDGWSEPVKTRPMLPLLQAEPANQEKTRSLSSNETEYSGGGGAESAFSASLAHTIAP